MACMSERDVEPRDLDVFHGYIHGAFTLLVVGRRRQQSSRPDAARVCHLVLRVGPVHLTRAVHAGHRAQRAHTPEGIRHLQRCCGRGRPPRCPGRRRHRRGRPVRRARTTDRSPAGGYVHLRERNPGQEHERTAAAAYTNTARYLTRPVGALLAGATASVWLGAPFVIAGAVKAAYDLTLWSWFRHVALPEEAPV